MKSYRVDSTICMCFKPSHSLTIGLYHDYCDLYLRYIHPVMHGCSEFLCLSKLYVFICTATHVHMLYICIWYMYKTFSLTFWSCFSGIFTILWHWGMKQQQRNWMFYTIKSVWRVLSTDAIKKQRWCQLANWSGSNCFH